MNNTPEDFIRVKDALQVALDSFHPHAATNFLTHNMKILKEALQLAASVSNVQRAIHEGLEGTERNIFTGSALMLIDVVNKANAARYQTVMSEVTMGDKDIGDWTVTVQKNGVELANDGEDHEG